MNRLLYFETKSSDPSVKKIIPGIKKINCCVVKKGLDTERVLSIKSTLAGWI